VGPPESVEAPYDFRVVNVPPTSPREITCADGDLHALVAYEIHDEFRRSVSREAAMTPTAGRRGRLLDACSRLAF
jgi:hypothetical protein